LTGKLWQISPIKPGDNIETLKALHSQGLSVRDISDRTGVPRSTVHRRLTEADE
jgi:IS30 family transposase